MIVAMDQMNFIAKDSSVKTELSNVNQVIVSHLTSVVMEIVTAETRQMKLTAHLDSLVVDTVPKLDSNVVTISAYLTLMSVTDLMIAEIIRTKLLLCVQI